MRLFCSRHSGGLSTRAINFGGGAQRVRALQRQQHQQPTSSSSDIRSSRRQPPPNNWLTAAAARSAADTVQNIGRPSVRPSVRPSPRHLVPGAQTTAASAAHLDRRIIKRTLTTSTATVAAAAGVAN